MQQNIHPFSEDCPWNKNTIHGNGTAGIHVYLEVRKGEPKVFTSRYAMDRLEWLLVKCWKVEYHIGSLININQSLNVCFWLSTTLVKITKHHIIEVKIITYIVAKLLLSQNNSPIQSMSWFVSTRAVLELSFWKVYICVCIYIYIYIYIYYVCMYIYIYVYMYM